MDFIFDNAKEEDIDAVLSLYKSNRGGPAGWDENYPSHDTIEFDMGRDALFVIRNSEGEVVACVSLDEDKEVEKLTVWNPKLNPVGEVSRLCVRSDYRGLGLAKKLMLGACEEWKMRGMKAVHILVRKGHTVALHTYSTLGFKVVGECFLHDLEYDCMEIDIYQSFVRL